MRKRERERKRKAFALLVAQVDKSMKRMPTGREVSKAWQDELALWQQSNSNIKEHTHPVVKGDHEYWEKQDLKVKRYSQGGTHERLRIAAAMNQAFAKEQVCDAERRRSLHQCFIGRGVFAIKWGCTYAG